MEQVTMMNGSRRSGWSEAETNLLWETADEAQQQGLPLKAVFERIAEQTGRRPNSIRNFYYAQVRMREGGQAHTARFVPFAEDEVRDLMEQVLRDRARGSSVRACLQRISNGDHSLMLRYQNKYRSVLKTRPELVEEIVEKLRLEGVDAHAPQVNHRPRTTLNEACQQLVEGAQVTGSPELIKACETLTDFMLSAGQNRQQNAAVKLDLYKIALENQQSAVNAIAQAAEGLVMGIKEFLGQPQGERENHLETFCQALSERIGCLEEQIQRAQA